MYIHEQMQGVERSNILAKISVETANTMSKIQSVIVIHGVEK